MSFSSNLYSVVKSVMAKTGVDATLNIPVAGSYDPSTGEMTGSVVSYPVRAIVMDFALISNGTMAEKNTLNAATDKQVYMDATQEDGSQPVEEVTGNGCTLSVGTTTYRITVVKKYDPSTTSAIMYDLKVEL